MRLEQLIQKSKSNAVKKAVSSVASKKSISKEVKYPKISRAVKSRPLTPMQQAYRDFFRAKLAEFGVTSPASLDESAKKDFFRKVKDEWPEQKKKIEGMLTDSEPMALSTASAKKAGLSFDFRYNPDYTVKCSSFVTFMTYIPKSIASQYKLKASDLQDAYQMFFKIMLEKYGVSSPADMDEDTKSEFFNQIKKDWPKYKKDFTSESSNKSKKKFSVSLKQI